MTDQFCVQCGSHLEPGSQFCVQCGTRVNAPTTTSLDNSNAVYPAPQVKSAAKAASNQTLLVILLVVLIPLLLITGFFLFRHLADGRDDRLIIESSGRTSGIELSASIRETSEQESDTVAETNPTASVSEPSAEETTGIETTADSSPLYAAVDFVPVPGRVYLFQVNYPSGETGQEKRTISAADDPAISSSATSYPDEPDLIGEQLYFVISEDGVSAVSEGTDYETLWLPLNFAEFDYWADEWESYMIIAVDQTITTGPYTFENCVIRFYENNAVDYQITEYLAPGHGVIYAEYAPGESALELLEWSEP